MKIKKYKLLIKKLFNELAIDLLGKNKAQYIRLEIETNKLSLRNSFWHLDKEIRFCIASIAFRIKYGYNNGYYNNRARRVNKYILHNRHNTIRFILLHELAHAKQCLENRLDYMIIEQKEYEADSIAIQKLKSHKKIVKKKKVSNMAIDKVKVI